MSILEWPIVILILGVLIFVHELGHFLVAKLNKVGVIEFAIGFGKKIWTKRIGETNYSVRLIPLVGFVRMVGDDPTKLSSLEDLGSTTSNSVPTNANNKSDQQGEALVDIPKEELELLKDRSKWFLTKPYLPKVAIVIAGPLFNLIFAYLLTVISITLHGRIVSDDVAVIGDLMPHFPAEKAGFQMGDRVKSIDGRSVTSWVELVEAVENSEGRELVFAIERTSAVDAGVDNKTRTIENLELRVNPTSDVEELNLISGSEHKKRYMIGASPKEKERIMVSFREAIVGGFYHVWFLSKTTIRLMGGLFQGIVSPKHIGGPIMMFAEAARSVEKGVEHVMDFMVFLSVSLAILNLLPIPVLDGGHLVFFSIEALKGSPVSVRAQEIASQVGIFLLLALTIFAFSNDYTRYISKYVKEFLGG